MLDVKVNGTNIFNPLEGKTQEIIEFFVSYYGEEHRERISERLNNTTLIFTSRNLFGENPLIDNIKNFYSQKEKYIYNKIFSEFPQYTPKSPSKFNSPADAYLVREAIGENSIDFLIYDQITDLIEMFGLETPDCPLIDYNHKTIDKWLSTGDNKTRVLRCLNRILMISKHQYGNVLSQLSQEKQLAISQLKSYDNQIESALNTNSNLCKIIVGKYLLQNCPKMQKLTDEEFSDDVDLFMSIMQLGVENFIKKDDFSSMESLILIEMFRHMGFNLGNDIRKYQTNYKLLACIFDNQLCKQVNDNARKSVVEMCKNNPYFQEVLQTIQGLDVKGGNLELAFSALQFVQNVSTQGAVMLQYMDAKTDKLKYVCLFPDAVSVCDYAIFHELNHVIESSLVSSSDKGFVAKCGFEVYEREYLNIDFSFENLLAGKKSDGEATSRKKRESEIFNEIINDYFALQMHQKVRKQGKIYAIGEMRLSSYMSCYNFLKDFIVKYEKQIINCRLSKDPKAFEKLIGEENMQLLSVGFDFLFNFYENYNHFYVMVIEEISQQTNIPSGEVTSRFKEYINLNVEWSQPAEMFVTTLRTISQTFERIDKKLQYTQKPTVERVIKTFPKIKRPPTLGPKSNNGGEEK